MPLPQPEPPKPLPPRWEPTRDPQDIHVPGLDTSAPVAEQIEQIEQLITIKLQNMDENFAAIHHLITTRLLPAIKRYSVASEPIREAARFWISFFQASAQVRMRMDGDLSAPDTSNDRTPTAAGDPDATVTTATTHDEADDGQSFRTAQNDLSFQPPPTSSTPLLSRSQMRAMEGPTPESSWAASIESPFSRLDREMGSLRLDEPHAAPPSASLPRFVPPKPRLQPPSQTKEFEFKDSSESSGAAYSPILRPPPTHADTTNSTTNSSTAFERPIFFPPPSSRKGKTTTPLRENIFRRNLLLSAAAPPASSATPRRAVPSPKKKNPWSAQKQWSGIVDLREQQPPEVTTYDSSDDEDALPAGMSPPVTMRFTRPSDVRLGRAPAPLAAQRVSRGFIADTARKSVGRHLQPPPSGTPGRRRPKRDSIDGSMFDPAATSSSSNASSSAAVLDLPRTPGAPNYYYSNEQDDGDDEESFWGENYPGQDPNAPPPQSGSFSDDDSDDDFAGGVPVPGSAFDSSYDHAGGAGSEATDTVFGARLAQLQQTTAPLRIHGTELLAETVDPAATDEAVPSVEQSPTPWAAGIRRPEYEFDV
ncbi:hypothetical protein EXIGLDRAFT_692584 [Exidia glandulosa HHB12029]|uniref:DASH complex subunit ASK1 n=1 Tax=Exidia glandulosa HHB12029 TaxID=1314781 RepID=A0A165HWI6_EXIGL|nr:hypothetical protein EXIGLDRAFT_692584 [Exidia glandulosa HHB12029]